jgi:hypothetical protein
VMMPLMKFAANPAMARLLIFSAEASTVRAGAACAILH